MILIKLFLSLPCASAAFVSTASRSLAAEFSRKRDQNFEELPQFRIPLNLPQMPFMPSMPNPLPFAYCDGLPENNSPNNFKNSFVIRPIIKALTGTVFDKRKFEEMIATWNYVGISEAFENDEIDFSYVPENFNIFTLIVDSRCVKGTEIMKRYFKSGLIEKLIQNGSITYHDLVAKAVNRVNYTIANLFLDIIINKYEPELNSPIYKTKSSESTIQIIDIYDLRNSHNDRKASNRAVFNCKRLDLSDIERFNYYRKIFLVLHGTENFPVLPYWKAELKNLNIKVTFHNCHL